MKTIQVYILDDHPVVRHGITQVINKEADMAVCGNAGELKQAINDIPQLFPDIVLADLSLNHESGIDCIHYLKTAQIEIPILVLSMHDELIYIKCSLEAGAKGYFHKNDSIMNIPLAIRKIVAGGSYFSDEISPLVLDVIANRSVESDSIDTLTPREKEIFRFLGEGKRRHQISEHLYISPKTVSAHIEKIKMKLNCSSSEEVSAYAVQKLLLRIKQ